jgi:large subunit ribosomal protein L13
MSDLHRRQTTLLNPQSPSKKWRYIDASGQSLGRLAAEVATVLMGKHKPEYTPHVDCGDYVVVINADKVNMTGKKFDHKVAWHYTGYPSGRKTETYGELKARAPEKLVALAVRRMLPKSRLGRVMLGNMKVVGGSEHPYAAHKPIEIKI